MLVWRAFRREVIAVGLLESVKTRLIGCREDQNSAFALPCDRKASLNVACESIDSIISKVRFIMNSAVEGGNVPRSAIVIGILDDLSTWYVVKQ